MVVTIRHTDLGAGRATTMLSEDVLAVERQEVSLHFPQFEYEITLIHNLVIECWEGLISPIPELAQSFKIRGVYWGNYPPSIPKVFCIAPLLTTATAPTHPHLNGDGSLCVFFPSDNVWKPERHTMADMLYFTSQWLVCHLYWERYHIWPWQSVPCGEEYAIKITGRNDACYCGSGLKYKKCCGQNKH